MRKYNLLLYFLLSCIILLEKTPKTTAKKYSQTQQKQRPAGESYFLQAREYFNNENYVDAAYYFWLSLLFIPPSSSNYNVKDAYEFFLTCFAKQSGWSIADGYGFLAYNYYLRGNMGEALNLMEESKKLSNNKVNRIAARIQYDEDKRTKYNGVTGEHPVERLYSLGNEQFEAKNLHKAMEYFEKSCRDSQEALSIACLNAVYCRSSIAKWGKHGKQFQKDMQMVEILTRNELMLYRNVQENIGLIWGRSASVHPHSMLGYPIKDVLLKRHVAESYAQTDAMYGLAEAVGNDHWREEMQKFPLDQGVRRQEYQRQYKKKDFKIKVGYLSAGMNTKAVIFLAQDVLRFHDKSKFEVHIFSTGAPDNPLFIEYTMRGVDWRKRVQEYADHFHDVEEVLKTGGPGKLAQYIYKRHINILIDWDGYCRNGIRAQGLYALRPAPVQIMHQEYLSTFGGNFDYLVTDKTCSPPELKHLYTENLIYMPHHFFSKGHAVQEEVIPPSLSYKENPTQEYVAGRGSPQFNRCGNPTGEEASFVFCNFNKFLKFSPETVRAWITVLENVPNSLMCLLENPSEGVKNLREFINDVNPNINDRIHFLSWENNPFDHQRRNFDFCNLILDCHPYNGHTTTMDALYAGVAVVTRSDGQEMSSLVTTSANKVLGLNELNAPNGLEEYTEIAIKVATTPKLYSSIRRRLVASSLQKFPKMHPFWDMQRYTKNFEKGLVMAWKAYLNNTTPLEDITIVDDEYEEEVRDSRNTQRRDGNQARGGRYVINDIDDIDKDEL